MPFGAERKVLNAQSEEKYVEPIDDQTASRLNLPAWAEPTPVGDDYLSCQRARHELPRALHELSMAFPRGLHSFPSIQNIVRFPKSRRSGPRNQKAPFGFCVWDTANECAPTGTSRRKVILPLFEGFGAGNDPKLAPRGGRPPSVHSPSKCHCSQP